MNLWSSKVQEEKRMEEKMDRLNILQEHLGYLYLKVERDRENYHEKVEELDGKEKEEKDWYHKDWRVETDDRFEDPVVAVV